VISLKQTKWPQRASSLKRYGEFQLIKDPAAPSNAVEQFHENQLIQLLRTGRAIPDRRRIELFLKALNTGELMDSERITLQVGVEWQLRDDEVWRLDPELIALRKEVLVHYLETSPRVLSGFGGSLCERLKWSIVSIPVFEMSRSGELVRNEIVVGKDDTAGLDYALLLLLSSSREFGRDLCKCRECGTFFLVEPVPKGRPRREYCSVAHRDKFFEDGAGARVKKSREEQRAAKKLGMDVNDYREMVKAGISNPKDWKKRRRQK
jgi:hypothetical protein